MKINSIKPVFISFLCLISVHQGIAQDKQSKFLFTGHLQNLNTVWVADVNEQWYTMSSVYNRLNLSWYPHQNWTLSASARNMFTFGQMIHQFYPYYTDLLIDEPGFINMTWPIAKDSSYVLYSNIDRANIQFNKGNFEMRVGRQRVNWGINLVWNPNDIFNTFNYYDFDYVERPGCDAVRAVYYTGVSSSVETAVKISSEEKITAAAMYRFNKWNYDFQVMGGVMEDDFVIGGGWTGYIKNAGFTGEGSYFRDIDNFADTVGILVLSASANYTFKNSIFIHGSFLFNTDGTTKDAGYTELTEDMLLINRDLSPKNFTRARYSLFGQVSYPITPLINADVSAIFNPNDLSAFIGPNLSFSISDNISLLLMSQIMIGQPGTEFGGYGSYYYLRLKWSL